MESRAPLGLSGCDQPVLCDQLTVRFGLADRFDLHQFGGCSSVSNRSTIHREHDAKRLVADAGEEWLKLVEQVEVLTDAVDDVPDLVGVIREDCNQLEAAVALHVADGAASVGFVVAQVHSGRSDGGVRLE